MATIGRHSRAPKVIESPTHAMLILLAFGHVALPVDAAAAWLYGRYSCIGVKVGPVAEARAPMEQAVAHNTGE